VRSASSKEAKDRGLGRNLQATAPWTIPAIPMTTNRVGRISVAISRGLNWYSWLFMDGTGDSELEI
jgi:hypothetical protein